MPFPYLIFIIKVVIKLKEKNINIKLIIFRLISALIIIICLIVLFLWQKDNSTNSNLQNDLFVFITEKNLDPENNPSQYNNYIDNSNILNDLSNNKNIINDLEVDFDSLDSINSDTVAWIKINNTNINFPVVQTSNNSYYLTKNFNKQNNSAGWIFADYRNNFDTLDKNTIVYGHNRRNGTMFSNLTYFLDFNWYENNENKYFNFITKNQSYIAEIFSIYKLPSRNISLINKFSSTEEFKQNIDSWKNASFYDFKTNVNESDNLLTLCTCDNTSINRIIIVSRLIPIN